jgi:hypothetical protein
MSKSVRTQRRYREANHGQQMLDAFAFTTVRAARSAHEDGQGLLPVDDSAVDNQPGQVTIREESVQVEIPPIIDEERVES